jgi:hypothetical protein
MKTSMRWLSASRVAVLAVLFLFCCSDPADEDVKPPENKPGEKNEVPPVDADAAMKAFSFTSATQKTGNVPTVVNSSLLKTDTRDTIYVLPQVMNIIRISHPKDRVVKGIFFAVVGSGFYYEVPLHAEEETDTVSVILYEIDPDEIQLPYDIPVEITAYDDNAQPIDILERIITLEEPNSGFCDILQDGDTTSTDWFRSWVWQWTVLLDHNEQPLLINAPAKLHLTQQEHSGCCENSACPSYVVDPNTKVGEWVYDSKFSVTSSYGIFSELFTFYRNGTFSRYTAELHSTLDEENTDYFNGVPSMKLYVDEVFYFGPHDYAPGDTQISYHTLRSNCADPLGLCGYGSRGGSVTASCHAMMISTGIESQKEVRMYTRMYGQTVLTEENGITRTTWSD